MVNKKKIAIVVSHPIQHFCPQYASFARHKDIQLKVFFASSLGLDSYIDPNFKKEICWKGLSVDSFEHEFVNGRKALPSNAQLDAPGMESALESYSPDLVVIYGYFHRFVKKVHRWATKNRIPLAYISDSETRQPRKGWKQIVKKLWLRRYFSKIDFFLTVGDANEEFYSIHGVRKQKFVRMHFPIDRSSYDQSFQARSDLRSSTRTQLGIAEDRMVACVVGKLVSWKSQDQLVDALAVLEGRSVQLDLLVAGSGETEAILREKLKVLRSNRVYLAGFVTPQDLPGMYAASDLYIHPAAREPHSIAISEAIAMGLPIICSSRCGSYGPTDDVQEGKNGFVYPYGDLQSLADKVEQIVGASQLRTTMGENSRRMSDMFQERAHGGVLDELLTRLGVSHA
jgi:glycosyltransferase involved in cell wall biosynthesis